MFNLADLLFLLLLLFHAYVGWQKGLFKSLLGPVSFLICCLLAWLYFKRTHNILFSLAISFIGPIFIKIFVPWIIQLANEGSSEASGNHIEEMNRVLGSAVGLLWGMIMAFFIVLFVTINPAESGPVFWARGCVGKSLLFSRIFSQMRIFVPTAFVEKSSEQPSTSDSSQAVSPSSGELSSAQIAQYQDLFNDERVKELIADPEVKELIENKQYMKLLQNPRFAKILDDPGLIARMVQMQSKLNKQK